MASAGEVTLLLQKADGGDRAAADALYRLVEKDLRAIAARRKRGFENALEGSTTVLVDDAFCRLVGGDVTTWQPGDRGKFYSYVANKIHDLLVEAARARLAQKRGGDRRRVDLEGLEPESPAALPPAESDFMIDLKIALERMESFAPDEGLVFRIYYFLGCTFDEAADILQISATEAKRRVRKAQLWLQRELKGYSV
ncbi:MAG: ECF-type sigma factor [Gemmataceae bacterium]